MLKRPLGVLGALGGWFLVIEPPRRQGRQGRQAVGETNRPNRDSACHSIRQSSNLINFPRFPCFPWTKNGLWAAAHAKSFRVFSLLKNHFCLFDIEVSEWEMLLAAVDIAVFRCTGRAGSWDDDFDGQDALEGFDFD